MGRLLTIMGSGGSIGGGPGESSLVGGLVRYYNMNEASGTRADSTGSGQDLTSNNGVTGTPAKIDNGALFVNAGSRSLSVANTSDIELAGQTMTLAGWASWNSNQAYDMLFTKGTDFQLRREAFSSDLTLLVENEAGSVTAPGAIPAFPTPLVFICAWLDSDADTLNLQINNGTVNTVSYTPSGSTDTNPFYFGRRADGFYHDGVLDEWGIWRRALSPLERTRLYNAGNGVTYPFS